MNCFALLFFCSCWLVVLGKRIALTDSDVPTPLLCTGANNDPVQWGGADMIRLIHQAQIIELGARGIRFVDTRWLPSNIYDLHKSQTDACEATPLALCKTTSGLLFPSSIDNGIIVTGMLQPRFNSSIARIFAEASSGACDNAFDGSGQGRTVVANETIYTASACDVMQGHLVTMFRPSTGQTMVLQQTFGPMAYTIILITALICIYGASSSNTSNINKSDPSFTAQRTYGTLAVCAAGTTACCLVYAASGIAFLTIDDEIHFWMSVSGTVLAGLMSTQQQTTTVMDVCIFMLGTIADALYRSPETPYASIFVVVLAVRAWQKVYTVCFAVKPQTSAITIGLWHVDLLFAVAYMCLTAEVGLVPQFADREDWPIYAGVGTFVTFLAAWGARAQAA